ncbi:outer membrane beta-barrel protein [Parasediminibacterium sp. JCM 36343]|uniref:outer membrane beta-barrel protein n=1 Tax=Parasediminibacterium sp. JCM 36343 TaxID=3374279 RepID=UPI00397A204F
MKRIYMAVVLLLIAISGFSQTDTTQKEGNIDTIKVGNFIIIKKNKPGSGSSNDNEKHDNKHVTVNINFSNGDKNKKPSRISTNWLIFDLGFANYQDKTNYTAALAKGYIDSKRPVGSNSLELNGGKSSNVNIWFFMQKLDVAKKVINLKYGLGLEMYNFRFANNVSYRNGPVPTIFTDSVNFSKDKLYASYLTIPLMVNINTKPCSNKAFSFSAGVSAGYLIGSRNKQISNERGKQKFNGPFQLNPFRLAAIGEIGVGSVRLYGSYSLNTLHKESTGLEQYPFAIGVRFSKW